MIPKVIAAEALLGLSVLMYAGFWVWAVIHAVQTPRATKQQRLLWGIALVANPSTAVWYWYVWKRRAFWALFTPLFGALVSLPLVVRSALSNTEATTFTYILYGLGSARLVILLAALMTFPIILRLAALFHLGKNTELSAMDRNDWIVSLALPIFGLGAGIAYCSRYRRVWAMVGLVWSVLFAFTLKTVIINISQALIPAGEERRIELRPSPNPLPRR